MGEGQGREGMQLGPAEIEGIGISRGNVRRTKLDALHGIVRGAGEHEIRARASDEDAFLCSVARDVLLFAAEPRRPLLAGADRIDVGGLLEDSDRVLPDGKGAAVISPHPVVPLGFDRFGQRSGIDAALHGGLHRGAAFRELNALDDREEDHHEIDKAAEDELVRPPQKQLRGMDAGFHERLPRDWSNKIDTSL